jgi:hypothetical protein
MLMHEIQFTSDMLRVGSVMKEPKKDEDVVENEVCIIKNGAEAVIVINQMKLF